MPNLSKVKKKVTKAKIKKMLKSGSDIYLTSEEAIKYGIADVLV